MKRVFWIIACCALALKLSLFFYAEKYAPHVKFQIDTSMYVESGMALVNHGVFARPDGAGKLVPEIFRTPGYPLFLGILHGIMRIPFAGIILIQMALTFLVAFITYKTALLINSRLGYLSALIVLFDPPVTIFSLMILTDTLFLLCIALFVFVFVRYLKERKIRLLILAAVLAAAATYVRPINYFLGAAVGVFLLYLLICTKQKKLILHLFVFLLAVSCLTGLWHLRNYRVSRNNTFTTMVQLASSYKKSYGRKDDAITQRLLPLPYYLNAVSRCLVSLMTEPGTLKDFNNGTLKFAGKIFGYLWVAFWMAGFLIGISHVENNYYLQFLLCVIGYFVSASIGAILFGVGYRLRVPMVPCLAILSAYGWIWAVSRIRSKSGGPQINERAERFWVQK